MVNLLHIKTLKIIQNLGIAVYKETKFNFKTIYFSMVDISHTQQYWLLYQML